MTRERRAIALLCVLFGRLIGAVGGGANVSAAAMRVIRHESNLTGVWLVRVDVRELVARDH